MKTVYSEFIEKREYVDVMETHLASEAKRLGYSSIDTAVSYLNSSVTKFRLEAESLHSIRDACWEAVIAIPEEGSTVPLEEFAASLPRSTL